jgi:hypothetical protein
MRQLTLPAGFLPFALFLAGPAFGQSEPSGEEAPEAPGAPEAPAPEAPPEEEPAASPAPPPPPQKPVAAEESAGPILQSGELDNTGDVLDKGTIQIYLLGRSRWALSDKVQLNIDLLRTILIGNAGLEWGVLDNDKYALSLEAGGEYSWDGSYKSGSFRVANTFTVREDDRFNLGLGVAWTDLNRTFEAEVDPGTGTIDIIHKAGGLGVPLSLSYDFVGSERHATRLDFNADLMSPGNLGYFVGNTGVAYYYGWDHFRIGVGARIHINEAREIQEILNEDSAFLEIRDQKPLDIPGFLPLPYLRLWWAI